MCSEIFLFGTRKNQTTKQNKISKGRVTNTEYLPRKKCEMADNKVKTNKETIIVPFPSL